MWCVADGSEEEEVGNEKGGKKNEYLVDISIYRSMIRYVWELLLLYAVFILIVYIIYVCFSSCLCVIRQHFLVVVLLRLRYPCIYKYR